MFTGGAPNTGTVGQYWEAEFFLQNTDIGDGSEFTGWHVSGGIPDGTRTSETDQRLSIFGNLTKAGTYTFSVGVANARGANYSQTYTVKVTGGSGNEEKVERKTFEILGGTKGLYRERERYSVSPAKVGFPYEFQFVISGDVTDTVKWSITKGKLPSGLTLDGNTGIISGTPTNISGFSGNSDYAYVDYQFTITATSGSKTDSVKYMMSVYSEDAVKIAYITPKRVFTPKIQENFSYTFIFNSDRPSHGNFTVKQCQRSR